MRYCRGCSTTHTYGIIWKGTRTNHVRRLHTPPPFIYVTDTVVFLYVVFCVVLCMQVYHILRNTLYTYIVCSRAYNLNTFMCTGVPWVFTEGTCNARKMFFLSFTCIIIAVYGKVYTTAPSVFETYVCPLWHYFLLPCWSTPRALCKKKTQVTKAYRSLGPRVRITFPL